MIIMKCCIKSKAARSILLWNFPVLLLYVLFDINNEFKGESSYHTPIVTVIGVSLIAVFAPMAGLLTDLKYSRYKAVMCSSYFLLVETMLLLVLLIVALSLGVLNRHFFNDINHHKAFTITSFFIAGILLATILVFVINSIRFGMDQLHDSPTEDSILFIHWYVWIYYLCSSIVGLPWSLITYDSYHADKKIALPGFATGLLVFTAIPSLLTFSLCTAKFNKVWFLIEPVGINPYKLVYKVVKFAYQHKVPLRRSAFAYCEDELPSRMDLGKQKYGGPFTTKEVEDVKAFWGILKIITCVGPVFMLQVATQSLLPFFAKHSNVYEHNTTYDNVSVKQQIHPEGLVRNILISKGLLSPLLVVVFIPLYLCLIRPRIPYYMPGMLKRIGLGIVFIMLSLVTTLVMDVVVHAVKTEDGKCLLSGITHLRVTGNTVHWNSNSTATPLYQNPYFFISQHFLSAVTNMLVDIALLEFILSQSPYSMKGLLLGYFFSIKGLFQAIAVASMVPFGRYWKTETFSCGSGFYFMNIIIAMFELVLFTYVAKKYKYRTVDEPSNEYRYAEEYYSCIR